MAELKLTGVKVLVGGSSRDQNRDYSPTHRVNLTQKHLHALLLEATRWRGIIGNVYEQTTRLK